MTLSRTGLYTALTLAATMLIGFILLMAGCANDTRQGRLTNVALSHLAKDAYTIALNGLMAEAQTGFTGDLGYNLQTSARQELTTLVSSEGLSDYLKAWNTPTTDKLAAIVPANLTPSGVKAVALTIADSQAAAVPQAEYAVNSSP